MKKTKIEISKNFKSGEISDTLFGSFIEHMGNVIYGGIYDSNHPYADRDGFRKDVLKKITNLDLKVIRYPGGNYTSGYDWKDSIGSNRVTKLDVAWKGLEPNIFGLHEFIKWNQYVGAQPILTLNLGTKGLQDVQDIIEYCNFPKGTKWSDLRRKNGAEKPFNIKYWCLGNELDGPWQIGRKTAKEYGKLANEASKILKTVDSAVKTILVGSSTPNLKSYPSWDRISLEQAYDNVDYLSLHNYIDKYDEVDLTRSPKNQRDDTLTYLAKSLRFDRQINEVIATCDYVKAVKRSDKVMYLSFDEWNVHSQPQKEHKSYQIGSPIDWCEFTLEDTLLMGSLGLAILRRADRVKISCQSLLVNTIPLIITDDDGSCRVNPTYYVIETLAKYARGNVLMTSIDSEKYSVEKFSNVDYVDCCVVDNDEELVIFLVNRDSDIGSVEINHNFGDLSFNYSHYHLISKNIWDKNTRENPDCVKLCQTSGTVRFIDKKIMIKICGFSWNVIRLYKK